MTQFATEFMKLLGPQVSSQLAGTLGIKKQTANQMIPNLLPLIMGGLKRQMETRGGAERANHILNKYGDAGVLARRAGRAVRLGGRAVGGHGRGLSGLRYHPGGELRRLFRQRQDRAGSLSRPGRARIYGRPLSLADALRKISRTEQALSLSRGNTVDA